MKCSTNPREVHGFTGDIKGCGYIPDGAHDILSPFKMSVTVLTCYVKQKLLPRIIFEIKIVHILVKLPLKRSMWLLEDSFIGLCFNNCIKRNIFYWNDRIRNKRNIEKNSEKSSINGYKIERK